MVINGIKAQLRPEQLAKFVSLRLLDQFCIPSSLYKELRRVRRLIKDAIDPHFWRSLLVNFHNNPPCKHTLPPHLCALIHHLRFKGSLQQASQQNALCRILDNAVNLRSFRFHHIVLTAYSVHSLLARSLYRIKTNLRSINTHRLFCVSDQPFWSALQESSVTQFPNLEKVQLEVRRTLSNYQLSCIPNVRTMNIRWIDFMDTSQLHIFNALAKSATKLSELELELGNAPKLISTPISIDTAMTSVKKLVLWIAGGSTAPQALDSVLGFVPNLSVLELPNTPHSSTLETIVHQRCAKLSRLLTAASTRSIPSLKRVLFNLKEAHPKIEIEMLYFEENPKISDTIVYNDLTDITTELLSEIQSKLIPLKAQIAAVYPKWNRLRLDTYLDKFGGKRVITVLSFVGRSESIEQRIIWT